MINLSLQGAVRGALAALALAGLAGASEAKIITPSDPPPVIKETPGKAPNIDYYIFGTLPHWYNNVPGVPPRLNSFTDTPRSRSRAFTGRQLLEDPQTEKLASAAERAAIETGKERSWTAFGGRIRGVVQPTKVFVNDAGIECRRFTNRVTVDTETAQVFRGTGCRATGGGFTIQKN